MDVEFPSVTELQVCHKVKQRHKDTITLEQSVY